MLKKLWNSSTSLLVRFELTSPPQVAFRKFREECDEFESSVFDPDDTGDPLEEAADVLVTVLNALYGLGYTYEQLESAIEKVCAKNDAKNWHSHTVVNDTIERRGRVR